MAPHVSGRASVAPDTGSDDSVLRNDVREFLRQQLAKLSPVDRARSWSTFDARFSQKLGARGWIGMTWPKRYGGHERDGMQRLAVLEELLAMGAPVGAHWVADRQSGPLLLRFGTEAQRLRYLPAIARGEMFFSIGMSEAGAGSDLAAVSTRAGRDGAGWRINGTKLWSTNAHRAHMLIALVRTDAGGGRHEGLSQFLIDLSSPGLLIRPIRDLTGDAHFNEIHFDNVFVPHENLVGQEGGGWTQVISELALERAGPERYLSSIQAVVEFLRVIGPQPEEPMRSLVGRVTAELWTLRQMSRDIVRRIARGEDPMIEASIVKDLGNTFEQEVPRMIQAVVDSQDLSQHTPLAQVMTLLLQISPSFSLRGGTREILRGIIARGVGLR